MRQIPGGNLPRMHQFMSHLQAQHLCYKQESGSLGNQPFLFAPWRGFNCQLRREKWVEEKVVLQVSVRQLSSFFFPACNLQAYTGLLIANCGYLKRNSYGFKKKNVVWKEN